MQIFSILPIITKSYICKIDVRSDYTFEHVNNSVRDENTIIRVF